MATTTIPLKSNCAPARSLWQRQRWLILRRMSQLAILLAFLAGPWFGVWIAKGNLSSSLTLGVLPLTDPLLVLQTLVTGHVPEATAFLGAALVTGFYLLVGGRIFCSWVCPVNVVTDAAAWSRRRLGIKTGRVPDANTRYWLLGGLLVAAAATGTLAWEWVNPVSLLHRGIIFGMGATLKHQITMTAGRVQETNYNTFAPVRMHEAPKIDIVLVKSTEKPGGIGEPATAVVAPAIANAVASLTGKRVRRLPITAQAIKQA